MRLAALFLAATLAVPATSQEIVFVIRHAEKEAGDDPALTEAGRVRAEAWARLLADAELDAVFTSTARRTTQTGTIVAEALGLDIESLPPSDTAGLMDLISFDYEEGRVLIVGHRETIPGILSAFGHEGKIDIGEDEFNRLLVVVPGSDGATLVPLRMP